MNTKKITVTIGALVVITLIGCAGANGSLGLLKTMRLNQQEFEALKSISVENAKGFKYVRTTLDSDVFKSTSTTTENQTLTDEDRQKIKEVLKKY